MRAVSTRTWGTMSSYNIVGLFFILFFLFFSFLSFSCRQENTACSLFKRPARFLFFPFFLITKRTRNTCRESHQSQRNRSIQLPWDWNRLDALTTASKNKTKQKTRKTRRCKNHKKSKGIEKKNSKFLVSNFMCIMRVSYSFRRCCYFLRKNLEHEQLSGWNDILHKVSASSYCLSSDVSSS